MAIDRTGISSLESGAPDIKYTGDQGPKSPDQELMASADPILVDEYKKYVFELKEIRPEATPMSFKQFVQEAMAGMAEGGIARLGYASGQLVKPGPGRPGYQGGRWDDPGMSPGTSRMQGPAGGATMGGGAGEYAAAQHTAAVNQAAKYHPSGTLSDPKEKEDFIEQKDIGTGDYRDFDPVTGDRIITPPIGGGGEGSGPTGPTPAEIEAMRIKLLLLQQEADKKESDEMVAKIKEDEEWKEKFALMEGVPSETLQYGDDRGLMYMAHGGRVPAAYGGLMGNDGRRAYGLGSFFKSVTKPFKKVAKTIKKVAKSPIGKLALGYLATAGLGNIGAGGLGGAQKWGGLKWLKPSNVFGLGQEGLGNIGKTFSNIGGIFPTSNKVKYTTEQLVDIEFDKLKEKFPMADDLDLWKEAKKLIDTQGATGGLGQTAMKAAAFGLPLLALKYPNLGEVPGLSMEDATAANQAAADAWSKTHLQGLDEEDWKLTSASELTPLQYSAQGGRIGYEDGKGVMMASYDYNDAMAESFDAYRKAIKDGIIPPTMEFDEYLELMQGRKETAPQGVQMAAQGGRIGYDEGKKVLPHRTAYLQQLNQLYGIMPKRKEAQEGGLMDLGGMEKDYRNEGGFVPIGGQERADDVPARLSKNEFVFTADAVRAAGGGDIDKGAEVMENVMENLEKGGNVSEESQGLEGARDMFATSQRLEGVL